MNFTGFVPMRRGILDHTMTGNLSLHQFAALSVLILLADKSTGSGKINAPVLRTYLPGLTENAAKRVLLSLEDKGYLFRSITPRSSMIYPYWVNGYQPTVGPYKLRQVSIAKALDSRDSKDIQYLVPAPEGALETAPDTALEGAHYNKKDKDKDKETDKLLSSKDGDSYGECSGETDGDERSESSSESGGERKGERHGESSGDTGGDSVRACDGERYSSSEVGHLERMGLQWRDAAWWTPSGTKVHPDALSILAGNETREGSI